MSWLTRNNSLGIDEDGEHNPQQNHEVSRNNHSARTIYSYNKSSFSDPLNRQYRPQEEHEEEDEDQSHGVKEDLSELTETLTRQLLGVAEFIAPPPPMASPPLQLAAPDKYPDQISVFDRTELSDPSVSGDDGLSVQDQVSGECGDSSGAGRATARGIPRFSDYDRAIPENIQVDRSYAQLGSTAEEPDRNRKAVGLTDEVLSFAGNIAHHPETWLDFPIEEEDDLDDFDMSDSQKEHAIAIESLTPRLRALRIELCPAHLSVGYFWKVYFVLLHSRLNKCDAELLSTSQVVEARAEWMHELQKRTKEELERQRYYKEIAFLNADLGPSSPRFQQPDNYSGWTFASEPDCSSTAYYDSDTKKRTVSSAETEFIDKSVIIENPVMKTAVDKNIMGVSSPKMLLHSFDDEDDDDWPEDDLSEDGKGVTAIPLGIEEEVSFSDLEDDDCSIHAKYNISSKNS